MNIKISSLFINLIFYLIMIVPIIFIIIKKEFYNSKKELIKNLILLILIDIFISGHLYFYGTHLLFFVQSGVANLSIYYSKILFITSPLYGIKYLIPLFIDKNFKNSKSIYLFISKPFINILLSILGFILFKEKGMLFAFPICDFIYYIIYLKIFRKYI